MSAFLTPVPARTVPSAPDAADAWNATETPFPAERCLHHAFEAHADTRPHAVALVHGETEATYAQVEARANRLANHLRALGAKPESRVAICLERGPDVVVAILAVLKAGGGFLPLDPAHPRERLARMVEGAGARIVITRTTLLPRLDSGGRQTVLVDRDEAEIARQPADRPRGGAEPANLAYVIYTSGSTGEPKGIALAHRGVVNNLWDLNRRVRPDDRVLLLSSPGFDMSVYETLGMLSAGGAVVIPLPAEARDPARWAALCRRHGVTVWNSAPALLGLLADHVDAHPGNAPAALRVAFLGGDWVPVALPDRVRAWAPGLSEFIVMGGATEASIHSILWKVDQVDPSWASIPYGRPMANQRAYVVDDELRALRPGQAGELYLGGEGLARGYTGRAGLTAERFVPDPLSGHPGARLYRTGDRARRWTDGTIELLGRADHQVKVRGFRVEPAEVEATLTRHPSVARAVVAGRVIAGETRLAAWLVAADPAAPPAVGELRAWVAGSLPEYMVPHAWMVLDALPLSPNGKVDRRALPAPPAPAAGTGGAPRTPVEAAVAAEVEAVLGIGGVGRDDDFFALGGHSLAATRLLVRLRSRLGADIPLRALFDAPTVAALAMRVVAAGAAPLAEVLPRVEGSGPFPLSLAQRRLWLVERMEPGSAAYHIPIALRLSGTVDAQLLRASLTALSERHEALRTVFGEEDGEPVQSIAPAGAVMLMRGTMEGGEAGEAALRRRLALEAARPFDLQAGPPFRALLLSAGEDDHLLLLVMHHLVGDGWTTGILLRDLAALYRARVAGEPDRLPPPGARYAEYALWRRGRVAALEEEQLAWWRDALSGAPALLALPTDRPRPAVRGTRGAHAAVVLPCELVEQARALGREHGATLHMVLLAALDLLLARYAGVDDIVVGTPAAGRAHPALDGVAGFFVDTLAIRVDLSGDPAVGELLARVREAALSAYEHQDASLDRVVEAVRPERSLSHTPLVQVTLALLDAPTRGVSLGGSAVRSLPVDTGEAHFDLTWLLEEDGDGVAGVLEYATDLFDPATAARMVTHFVRLLEGMAAASRSRISSLRLLTLSERAAEIGRAGPAAPSAWPSSTLHAAFAARAARTPSAIAVSCEDTSLTYAELDAWSGRLAARLRRAGVAPGDRVGLMCGRSAELVAGIVAVLRAGAAYVPLDPAYPADRLAYIAEDARLRVVLARAGLDVPEGAAAVPLDDAADEAEDARGAGDADALAYVIYTSGSTGRPKGVEVSHGHVLRLFSAAEPWFRFGAADVWTLFHSFAFDFAVWEMWGALLYGGRVVVVTFDESRSPEAFYALLERDGVTVLNQTPSAFWPLMRADEEAAARGAARRLALREVIFGGEALDPGALAGWMARHGDRRPRMVNMYGITETTVLDTIRPLTRDDLSGPPNPIGVPLADLSVHVLDPAGEPQPAGVPGELHIGGAGVARGYLGRPALTAQRFIPDAFSAEPGARLYRSGDRARRLPSGELEYLGRIDQQIKVRGFRIEPGEIEAVLRAHSDVRGAVVLARAYGGDAEPRLVAWVAAPDASGGLGRELRDWAAARLPSHMVPATFVPLRELPLTRNGKVDARALPAPDQVAPENAYRAPVTERERVLAAVWAEVLGVQRVGMDDDFFALGGHSLQAARMVSRLRAAGGVDIPVRALFEDRTLAALAARVEALSAPMPETGGVDEGEESAGSYPASSAQRRLWFLEQLDPGKATYNVPAALRLRGPLNISLLAGALDEVVRRHGALRTVFAPGESGPVQVLHAAAPVPLPVTEVADEEELWRGLREEAHRPLELEGGPLLRALLFRRGGADHVLLLVMHHAVADGWSVEIVLREAAALYAEGLSGTRARLPVPFRFGPHAAREADAESAAGMEWWRDHLRGAAPVLNLPADRPRPAVESHRGAEAPFLLSRQAMEGVRDLARAEGVTLHMALLAGWILYLSRAAGVDDLVVGDAAAGRDEPEAEAGVGMFVRTLPVRVGLDGDPTVRGLLRRVREAVLGAREHQSTPLDRLVEALRPARDRSHAPLFQAVFVLNPPAAPLPSFGPVAAERVRVPLSIAQFDLLLEVQEEDGGAGGVLQYATDLFDRATAERMAAQLARMVGAMAAAPDARISALPWLDAEERRRVLREWNPRPRREADTSVHALFTAQAARTPDAVAVVHNGARVSYAGLNARADQLAHRLRRAGAGPEVRVAVCLERTPELVAALLAVLKSGAAYVPLDPAHPAARTAGMMADAGATLALASAATVERLPAGAIVVRVDDESGAAEAQDAPVDRTRAESLAYVLFTSGSTGRPKGVMVTHGGVSALLHWLRDAIPADERAAVLASTPVTFDVAAAELFGTLCWGGTLVLAENALALADVGDEVRLAVMVPTAAAELLRAERLPRALRAVNLGGEPVSAELARGLYAAGVRTVRNLYGPTEDTVYSTCATVLPDAVRVAIGRPAAGSRARVLGPDGSPVPPGIPGELFLGGDGVARGYANRPALTAERFLPDPFADIPGARMYRTGDAARWTDDGDLLFLGRLDAQVKVRGFRVEPGEVEAALRAHPSVREAAVVPREGAGGAWLAGYFTLAEGGAADGVREHLAALLPGYMVPSMLIPVDALPRTSSGKLDRNALPAAADDVPPTVGAPPRTEVEEVLAAAFAEALGVERVGIHDSFFDLGGHSLLAWRLASRVPAALGGPLPVAAVFAAPTVAGLAARLAAKVDSGDALPPIVPVARGGTLPLSAGQEALWYLDQVHPGSPAYSIPCAIELRGRADAGAIARALGVLAARHEALRTTLQRVDGAPAQVVADPAPVPLPVVAISRGEVDGVLREWAERPFDLGAGPLFRAALVRVDADEHLLLIAIHHAVADGASVGILLRELREIYSADVRGELPVLPPQALQYADFAAWQRTALQGGAMDAQLAWWRERLAGAPPVLELPADRPRPPAPDDRGFLHTFAVPPVLEAPLRTLAREEGATLFMVLAAGWNALLARWTGAEDLVVGVPVAGRGMREMEGVVGFFSNTLVLRTDVSGNPPFREMVRRTRDGLLGAYAHADAPFERLVEALRPLRDAGHAPVVQAIVHMHEAPGGDFGLPGLRTSLRALDPGRAKFDLALLFESRGGELLAEMTCASALFDPATATRMADGLMALLRAAADDPERRLGDLPTAGEEELRRAVEVWNATEAACPRDLCIHHLFAEQAARTPLAEAVAWRGGALTYAELDARADRLARRLASRGAGPEARVGVCLERGPDAITALLAVLKSGACYVPLDPEYPPERLRYMAEDSRAALVITRDALRTILPVSGTTLVLLDSSDPLDHPDRSAFDQVRRDPTMHAEEAGRRAPAVRTDRGPGEAAPRSDGPHRPHGMGLRDEARAGSAVGHEARYSEPSDSPDALDGADRRDRRDSPLRRSRVEGGAGPGNLCYLVYTSGSTGRPKGAMVEHRGVPNLILAQNRHFGLGPGDRVLQFAPLGFDASISEIFLALATGATLCIPPEDSSLPGPEMVRAMEEMAITKVKLTASALAVLPPSALPALRVLVLGGEACPRALAARWATPGRRVWSVYGPTEATARVCLAECTAADDGPGWVPLGRVMDNDRVYVLDRWGRAAAPGVPGELCIGGVQVGRGYLNRPALTAERFVPDPFCAASGARLYRTGDRVRWTADGELEFLGRMDLQVKLRGFRVEPGEVEEALRTHPAVRDAVVDVRAEGGEARLVAWVVADAEAPAPAALRDYLRARLPGHMVPTAYAVVDRVPLTPNGKVDRAALPVPGLPRAPADERRAPETETERRMAAVWAEVLGCGEVGMDDDFFLLGGHSLAAVRLAFRIREAFGAELPLRALLDAPSVAGTAERVDGLLAARTDAGEDAPSPAPLAGDGAPPLSIVQEHLWLVEQRGGGDPFSAYPASVRLEGPVNAAALRRALDEVLRRHESLRTVFRVQGARPVQVVLPPGPAPFHRVDLTGLRAEDSARAADRIERTARPFNLERGPLFHVTLVRTGARSWRLLYGRHHLIGDGWSGMLLLREISVLYNAFAAAQPSPLPEPALQYGDWAAWQRRLADGPAGAAELAWWRQRLRDARAPALAAVPEDGREVRPCQTRRVTLDGEVLRWLRQAERREGSTLFMLLLAAVKALLARYTGETDLCVFTPVAGRTHPRTEPLIGFFSHQVLLRTEASGNPSSRALLGRVRETVLDALSHQDLPCVERPDLTPAEAGRLASLCRMGFACAPDPGTPLDLRGVGVLAAPEDEGAGEPRGYDSFTFVDRGDRVDGRFDFRAELYPPGLPDALVSDLAALLRQASADPDRGIFDLALGTSPAALAPAAAEEPDFAF